MKVESNDFQNEGSIPEKFTCDGTDISPHLKWSEFPSETKSFAITCIDPDAPGGSWIHWLVYNIPKTVDEIKQGATVSGTEVTNDFGKISYGGPCPPSGTHRYYFTIYALSQENIENVKKRNFVKIMEKNALDKCQIMGKYSRKR